LTQYTFGLTRRVGHGLAFSQVLSVDKPAAGAGWTYANDGLYWEYIDSVSFQMVTGSNAANRLVNLTVKDGTGVALATVPPAAALTASKTGQFTYLDGYSATTGATDGPFLNIFPGVWLQPQFSIVVTVTNVDAADQISNIRIYAERFVTGESGYLLGVQDLDPFEMELRTKALLLSS
jgi:hypothetical protein